MCRRFAVGPAPPRPGTIVGIAMSRPRELDPPHALRHEVVGTTSGWFVWRGADVPQEDDHFFQPMHVEHLDGYAPELAPYLALPPGWRVLLAPGHEDVWYDKVILDV
ncbi:immunity protein Imm33 domain-containing protein [Rugosimonospora africana]|uniref:immunity protein Imm33 domain-containing protein n=1 Tax=Rugosimonospora africana TaxID=556532 RepID=UPI0040331352